MIKKNLGFVFKPLKNKLILLFFIFYTIALFFVISFMNQKSRYAIEYRFTHTTEELGTSDCSYVASIFTQKYEGFYRNTDTQYEMYPYFFEDTLVIKIVGSDLEGIQSFAYDHNQKMMLLLQEITLDYFHTKNQAIQKLYDQYQLMITSSNQRLIDNDYQSVLDLSNRRLKSLLSSYENRIKRYDDLLVSNNEITRKVMSWSISNIKVTMTDHYPLRLMTVGLIIFVTLTISALIYDKKELQRGKDE